MTYAAIRPEAIHAQPYPEPAPPVSKTTWGPRCAWVKNTPTTAMTPTISQQTPMVATRDIQRTPMQLMVVVIINSAVPNSTALAAPSADVRAVSVPMIWKPDHTAGSTTCSAMAAADAVMICARIMNQPPNQPTTSPPRRRAHW